MTDTPHVDHLLSGYLDGNLPASQHQTVKQHIAVCPACSAKLTQLTALVTKLQLLPQHAGAPRDLWAAIETRINQSRSSQQLHLQETQLAPAGSDSRWRHFLSRLHLSNRKLAWTVTLAAVFVLGMLYVPGRINAWKVTPIAGVPYVGETGVTKTRTVNRGDWLETDATSHARLKVGNIGSVDLSPGTRLQLRNTETTHHRLNLAYGRIHARIWAPPRQFFVETPAGLAIDLGCEYTLEVDSSGHSLLHVRSGFVGFARGSREVIAPAGWMVRARPNQIPGSPYSDTATPAFREALERFDFESKSPDTVTTILREARPEDAITLWELLWRTDGDERARIYDKLKNLVPPPPAVTKTGVLLREPAMIAAWRNHLGISVEYWLSYKKRNKIRSMNSVR